MMIMRVWWRIQSKSHFLLKICWFLTAQSIINSPNPSPVLAQKSWIEELEKTARRRQQCSLGELSSKWQSISINHVMCQVVLHHSRTYSPSKANGSSAHAKAGHLRTPKASQLRTPKASSAHANPFRYDPLGWGEPSWTSFASKGYDPLGWGGNHHGHPLLPRGTTL